MPETVVVIPGATCPECGKSLEPLSAHERCMKGLPTGFVCDLLRRGLVRLKPVPDSALETS
jgi:hypothetical protein